MDDLRYQIDLLTALNQKLNNNERMYKLICETSKRAFIYINYINNTVKMVGKWEDYIDFRIDEAAEITRLLDIFTEKERGEIRRLLFIEKEGKDEQSYEAELRDEKTWVKLRVNIYRDEFGVLTDKIIAIENVTKLHNHRDELTYLAYYDNMTNLYNRNYFITKLKNYVEMAESEKKIVSVMLIDIDDFHKISDSRGIVMGDEVIQNFGLFLNDLTENYVIGSRFDSDIFCLAIYDPCGHRSVETIYKSIKEFLSHPIRLTDMTDVSITVSIGVAEFPEASDNALQLINCAEIVMLKAKEAGKNNLKFFDSSILNNFLRDVSLENKLKEAIFGEKFFMNFQPQFYTESGKIRGVEALIRWRDRDGTFISPSLFIPIAEKNGAIVSIGDFVLEESIKAHMNWKMKFDFPMILSVNISSIQYNRQDFVPKVIALMSKYNMKPEELELEITESVLIDDFKSVISKMMELRDYGIKVSLDDFGTGFSSLSYLKGLPIDTLKIDKSFIDNITTDNASWIIAETIISMSKRLGFETVAEGVETREQYEKLKEISCDLIQGFYLGHPMEAKMIEELLIRNI